MNPLRILVGAAIGCCAHVLLANPPEWHFEFSGVLPDKLVWQTETGWSYDLWQATDPSAWTHVYGYPKKGTGGAMIHTFNAGMRGFFKIVSTQPSGPTDLLVSEYVEGSSLNKALEIFNPTGVAVDLADGAYDVQIYYNGNSTAGGTISLSGIVPAGGVHVLANPSAYEDVLLVANQLSATLNFNGDDAVALRRQGTLVDVIGQIGFDPGSEWGTDMISTMDNTLRRKASVTTGDPNGADPFDPAVEWDGYPVNTFSGLGSVGDP